MWQEVQMEARLDAGRIAADELTDLRDAAAPPLYAKLLICKLKVVIEGEKDEEKKSIYTFISHPRY